MKKVSAASKRRLLVTGAVSLIAAGMLSTYLLGRARAAGAPATQPLTYSGVLTDTNGTPLTGMRNIQVVLWDMAQNGTQQCAAGPTMLPLNAGAFELPLPAQCAAAVHASPELWIEVFVGGESVGRTKVGAVPFALESQRASEAAGALATTLGTVGTRLDALESRATALEMKTVLTAVDFSITSPTEDFASACRSTLNAQACGVLAGRHCRAAGYLNGWFVGESADGNSTFYAACVK